MYKIKNIKLTNFKFFFGDKNIKFDLKHILIYGENGSGKSSIYWALHCFLHSTLKKDVDSVRKYFLPLSNSDESIKNRYAHDGKNSGVSITLAHQDHQRYADISAEVSNNVVNTQTNDIIKLMTLSSELINYRTIYNMYLATNRSSVRLFDYFTKNLMEFINLGVELTSIYGNKISQNSLEWWKYIEKGVVPYTTMTDPRYIQFQEHVDKFNEKFSDYLQLITGEANRCLQEDFKEDFRIKFKYTKAIFNDFKYDDSGKPHGRTRSTTPPEIELIVELPNLTGKAAIVERPQSYLNEARLTSIAIAIRLAILRERYIDKAPRIMVLDDLLLSLDLGNRSSLLKIIFEKYASIYQLIILTHDRTFFDCVINHLSDNEIMDNWKLYEMYETLDGDRLIPSIVTYQSPLSKAYAYFRGNNRPIDYNACGNNQRQALEAIFKEQFRNYSLRNDQGELISLDNMMIAECISRAMSLYPTIMFDINLLQELDIHRKQSLNPSSHHNPQSNFYKKEIERTFEIIHLLQQHKIEKLVIADSIITLDIRCDDDSILSYKIQLLDDILIYKKPESVYYIIPDEKRKYCIREFNREKIDIITNAFSLKELYDDTIDGIIKHVKKTPMVAPDIFTEFKHNGISIHELLNQRNYNFT